MKRSCFSEGQIIDILKEHQAGLGAKKMKALETDNAKLKKSCDVALNAKTAHSMISA